jgi:hypothetical protein
MPGLDGLQIANRAMEMDPSLRGGPHRDRRNVRPPDALAFALQTTVISKPLHARPVPETVEPHPGQIPKGA